MMINMVLGTFPNMVVVDNKAEYSKARLRNTRTLTAAQFSTPEECRDRWEDDSRSQFFGGPKGQTRHTSDIENQATSRDPASHA